MTKKEWSKDQIDFLRNNYLSMSNDEISKTIGRTRKAVQVKLSKLGLKRPDKYYYNKRFFQCIDTKEKAYWLGFLYADGYVCISESNSEVGVELSVVDVNHLKKFNKALEGNIQPMLRKERKGVIKPTQGIVSFRIYSKEMAQDLISNGCTQNKTFSIKFPSFENRGLMWSFIRGYFDGDGSVYRDIGRKFIGFNFTSGSKEFLEGLKKFLYEDGIYGYLSEENRKDNRFQKNSKSYKLLITGMNNAYRFGEKLYEQATIFLDRKKVRYDNSIKEYNIKERIKLRPYHK